MALPSEVRSRLAEFVRVVYDDLILVKNPDLWESLERGGDWDLIVRDVERVRAHLVAILGPPVAEFRRTYVSSLFWEWGHIDLLPDIRWRGIVLVDYSALAVHAVDGPEIRVATLAHQAVAACIYGALAHKTIKVRYRDLWQRVQAEDPDLLRETLSRIFSESRRVDLMGFDELTLRRNELVRSAWSTALRERRRETVRESIRFISRESRLRIRQIDARSDLVAERSD